jgi:UDP-N-acetyl-D-glucosamine dehydrogenase
LFKSNKSMNKKILGNLVVVGLGYVGLPLALLADRKNWDVTGVDNNPDKIEKINNKIAPFADEKISAELKTSTLKATSDKSVVKNADIIILCVPTPVYEDHMPNLEPVISACEGIAPFLTKGQLVILESTVNPGVCEEIVIPILEKNTALKAGEDFYVAHCPERIDPGNTNWDVETIPRVVGSLEKIGLTKAMDFYGSILISKVKPMNNLKEAEAVKIIENVFRDINIAFVNELAMSFQRLGIDVVNVIEGAGTKPFAFMPHFPGCGVGGHCIPVDPYYLIDYAKKNGFRHEFLYA